MAQILNKASIFIVMDNEQFKQIINHLNQNKSNIIEALSANNWKHFKDYYLIRDKYFSNDLDDQFKHAFCSFYIMNGPMGLNNLQKIEYFKLLSLKETDLRMILIILYEIPGYGNGHRLFLSFGTKLLHTVNKELPIYDRNIACVLKLPPQTSNGSFEEKIKNRIDIYEDLKKTFKALLKNNELQNYLKGIRKELEHRTRLDNFQWQDKYVSDAKLLDSLLWALYRILKSAEEFHTR
jgi:hypothetical protein